MESVPASNWNQFQKTTKSATKMFSGKEIKTKLALNMECGLRQKK